MANGRSRATASATPTDGRTCQMTIHHGFQVPPSPENVQRSGEWALRKVLRASGCNTNERIMHGQTRVQQVGGVERFTASTVESRSMASSSARRVGFCPISISFNFFVLHKKHFLTWIKRQSNLLLMTVLGEFSNMPRMTRNACDSWTPTPHGWYICGRRSGFA